MSATSARKLDTFLRENGLIPARSELTLSVTMVSKPRPFVKWVGGKTRLLPELLARAPRTYGKYIEPFVGGGALFWKLSGRGGVPAVIADSNLDVMVAYRTVRDHVDALVDRLRKMRTDHSESHYYAVRAVDPSKLRDVERAARFIYLNKTCFNGLWRVNKSNQFNAPVGRGMNPAAICDEDNLQACSRALVGVRIHHGFFPSCDQFVEPGDFVYMDPPYVPRTGTSNFTIAAVRARRNVNSDGESRSDVTEFLIY